MKNNVLFSVPMLLTICSTTFAEQKRPNIVFILADDMGYGDVSYLDKNSKLKTVNLDRMASEGVVVLIGLKKMLCRFNSNDKAFFLKRQVVLCISFTFYSNNHEISAKNINFTPKFQFNKNGHYH